MINQCYIHVTKDIIEEFPILSLLKEYFGEYYIMGEVAGLNRIICISVFYDKFEFKEGEDRRIDLELTKSPGGKISITNVTKR